MHTQTKLKTLILGGPLKEPLESIQVAWDKLYTGQQVYLNRQGSSPPPSWRNFAFITFNSSDGIIDCAGRIAEKWNVHNLGQHLVINVKRPGQKDGLIIVKRSQIKDIKLR